MFTEDDLEHSIPLELASKFIQMLKDADEEVDFENSTLEMLLRVMRRTGAKGAQKTGGAQQRGRSETRRRHKQGGQC